MKSCTKCRLLKPLAEFHKATQATDGRRTKCLQCEAVEAKQRRLRNQEKYAEAARLRRVRDQEKNAERKRRYQSGPGKEKMLAGSRRYGQSERGREIRRKNQQKYAKTERGRAASRIRVSRRRARLLQAEGTFTTQEWVQTIQDQKNRCFYCKKAFTKRQPPTIDHVIPLSAGGRHDRTNIVAACRPCNSKKWTRRILLT